MTSLAKRAVSGIVLVFIILFLIAAGGAWFHFLCGSLFLLLNVEWAKIWWRYSSRNTLKARDIILIILGVAYISFALYKYWTLRDLQHKQITTFLVVWSTDVGAYLFGKKYGKTLLAPIISPQKTWEGFWGGIFLCVLVGLVVMHVQLASLAPYSGVSSYLNNFFDSFSLFSIGVFSIRFMFYSVAAHLGDLLESWVKRYVGIKDSGNLIPGHGGVLDRFDSFLSVCVAYYVKDLLHYYGIFF